MIGRKRETDRLQMCMEADEAQLIAVYGRRRVGKTYLIESFFNGRFDFMLTGIYDQAMSVQLRNFATELSNQTGQQYSVPGDWMEAFGMLRTYLSEKKSSEKIVCFFDEMPWMDTQKSDFLPAFEWFWNGWGHSVKNLVFVVCGSATAWMLENIDKNKGGLYRRLTCRIYLAPFSLYETEEFLKAGGIEWSRYEITQCYMIMGGIPYYLKLLDPAKSFSANIDNIFFRKRAELWDEFSFLYRTLFKNSEKYVAIAAALSTKRSGMTREEIIAQTGLPGNGVLTAMLENLEYSGFIRIEDKFGSKKKVYQLSDYYSCFYFRFIKDNYGTDEHFWTNSYESPAKNAWAGLTFEQICKDHISQIKQKIGISGVRSAISSWSCKGDKEKSGAQIDLLIDRGDKVTNICEIKYSSNEYEIDKDYDLSLRNKIGAFVRETGTKHTIQVTMITTYGVKKGKYSGIVNNQVTIDDLFRDMSES